MMDATFLFHHASPHVKAVEEDSSNPQCYLWEVEHDASCVDEINAFGPPKALLRHRESIYDAGCARYFVGREVPLIGTRDR